MKNANERWIQKGDKNKKYDENRLIIPFAPLIV
jgi:hypothetical protein